MKSTIGKAVLEICVRLPLQYCESALGVPQGRVNKEHNTGEQSHSQDRTES